MNIVSYKYFLEVYCPLIEVFPLENTRILIDILIAGRC